MSETLPQLLLQLSEAGDPVLFWGRQAKPHLGRAFDRLLNIGVLVEEAPATEWDVCPDCDCGLDARPIEQIGGQRVAICPTDRRSDVVLDHDDLRSFRIRASSLVREIALASGFPNAPSTVAAGVWHLGQTSNKRELFLTLSRSAVLQPGLVGQMRASVRSAAITVISPEIAPEERSTFVAAEILLVSRRHCFAGGNPPTGLSLDHTKLGLHSENVPRLVIRRTAKSVTLDGIPKSLSDQAFQLLLFLAEHALRSPAIVANREIEAQMWGASLHKISSQVREPVRVLRDALAIGSTNPESIRSLIENRRNPNGYRLALGPEEIKLVS